RAPRGAGARGRATRARVLPPPRRSRASRPTLRHDLLDPREVVPVPRDGRREAVAERHGGTPPESRQPLPPEPVADVVTRPVGDEGDERLGRAHRLADSARELE